MNTQTSHELEPLSTSDLPPCFFQAISKAESEYAFNKQLKTLKILLEMYTDCISYFEEKQQSVSIYFQMKIKQLLKDIKIFHVPNCVQINKNQLAKQVMKGVQEEDIHSRIKEAMTQHNRQFNKIQEGLRAQEQHLQQRLRKAKRGEFNRTLAGSLSVGSIFSTPSEFSSTAKKLQSIDPTFEILIKDEVLSDEDSEIEVPIINIFACE